MHYFNWNSVTNNFLFELNKLIIKGFILTINIERVFH